jgi:hypothetical protein
MPRWMGKVIRIRRKVNSRIDGGKVVRVGIQIFANFRCMVG